MHIISYPVRGFSFVQYVYYFVSGTRFCFCTVCILFRIWYEVLFLYCKHIISYPVRGFMSYPVRVCNCVQYVLLIIFITYAGCPAVVSGAGPLRRVQRHVGK